MRDPFHHVNLHARPRSMRQWLDQQNPRPRTMAEVNWLRLMDAQLKDNHHMERPKDDAARIAFEAVLIDAKMMIERDGLFPEGWDAWPPAVVAPVR